MNEFYSISEENKEPINSYQLKNLGVQTHFMTFGKTSSMWGEKNNKSETIYTKTTDEHYDRSFTNKLTSIKPPYEINKLLDFHLNYYVNEYKGNKEKFIKQIKYVVLPLIRKQKNKETYIELTEEWIEGNNGISKNESKKNNKIEPDSNYKIEAINVQLTLLKQSECDAASWIFTTERLLKKIFPNEEINLKKLRIISNIHNFSGGERTRFENMLNGFIRELEMQSPSEELKTFQTTLKKKYQIFISSTFTDLKKEREAAVEAILKAGHIPAGMELFKAGKETLETIQKWIDESDLYILILGGRYGSIHEESGKSYTEIEYRYALEKNKFPFAIIIKDEALKNKVKDLGEKDAIEVNNTDKYDAFKKYVQKSICAFFDDEKDIKLHIANNITNIINENGHLLNGWISGRDANFQFIEEVTEKNDFPMAVPPPEKMTIEKRAQIIKKKKEFEEYKRGYFMPDSYAMDDSKKFVADLYNILTDKINSLEDKKYQIRHNQRNSNLINIIYEGLVLIFEWRIKYGNSLTDSSLKVAIKKWTQLDTIPLPTESWTVSQSYEYDFGINEDHQNVWGDKKKPSYIFNNTEIADMWLNLFMNELES